MSRHSNNTFDAMIQDAHNTVKAEKIGSAPWKRLYQLTLRNYLAMQGEPKVKVDYAKTVVNDAIQRMYDWYKDKYSASTTSKAKAEKDSKEKPQEKETPHREIITSVLVKNHGSFEKRYKFSKPYTRLLFTNYLNGNNKPSIEFILHLAVAFKFSPKECNEVLQSFEYFPLHSKNIFHLAIYCVLREIETQRYSFLNDFKQFDRLQKNYRSAITALATSQDVDSDSEKCDTEISDYLPREPHTFKGGNEQGSSTQLMQFVQRRISSEQYLQFILRHKDELNEQHSKIRKEYFRLLDVSINFFDKDSDAENRTYSFHEFILQFCKNLERKHFKRDLVQKIKKEGREPTREILIILWTWEYCFLTAGSLKLTLSDALDFLRKAKDGEVEEGKIKGISVSDKIFVESVFSHSENKLGFWEQVEAVKEWKQENAQPLEDNERKDIERFFDVEFSNESNNIVIDTSKLLKKKYLPTITSSPWGSRYMLYMNAKLRSFGFSILSAAKSFDRCFMMLQHVNFKENTDGATTWYYQSSSAHTNLLHLEIRNQFGYPDGLRFLFLYLDAYKKLTGIEYPLECSIYQKL